MYDESNLNSCKQLDSNLDIELSRLSPVEILIFRDLANDSFLQKFLKKYHLTILDSIPHRDLSIEIMKKSNFDQAIVDLNEVIYLFIIDYIF